MLIRVGEIKWICHIWDFNASLTTHDFLCNSKYLFPSHLSMYYQWSLIFPSHSRGHSHPWAPQHDHHSFLRFWFTYTTFTEPAQGLADWRSLIFSKWLSTKSISSNFLFKYVIFSIFPWILTANMKTIQNQSWAIQRKFLGILTGYFDPVSFLCCAVDRSDCKTYSFLFHHSLVSFLEKDKNKFSKCFHWFLLVTSWK